MEGPATSVASTLSWNTFLSRTSVSSLSAAVFSEQQGHVVHGLEDIIRAVRALRLQQFAHKDIAREESLGEGETYRVQRCVSQGSVFAIKYLKTNFSAAAPARPRPPAAPNGGPEAPADTAPDNNNGTTFHRRLRSVILELQIMRHGPLRSHPNFPAVVGYGWNTTGANQIMPYILMEYAEYGTLRQFLRGNRATPVPPGHIEILLGDVAAALSALHTCGIVHGDVKLDNVLVIPSWDRPSKTLAKLTDFGHALIMNDKSRRNGDAPMRYGGTLIYNAPEVKDQDLFPIDLQSLPKCDIWAFGLLVWEACIGGEEYLAYLQTRCPEAAGAGDDILETIKPPQLLQYAMRSVPGPRIGPAMLIRASMSRTMQEDPAKRVSDLQNIPVMTKWQASGPRGLEADLALHLKSPSPTYEMFRSESGREIPWTHEKQIFNGLKQTYDGKLAKENSATFLWQIALCYHVGFGTARNPNSAQDFARRAKNEGHPLAKAFEDIFAPREEQQPPQDENEEAVPDYDAEEYDSLEDAVNNGDTTGKPSSYAARIATLMHESPETQPSASPGVSMPPLVKACFDGDGAKALELLRQGENPNLSTIDGCTAFHWLFMFRDAATLEEITEALRRRSVRLLVDAPFHATRTVHEQWPLQFTGSPLSVLISVNDLAGVRALLSLGADPLGRAYCEGKFPPEDPKSEWTALHLAAKFHCSQILLELLVAAGGPKRCLTLRPPLAGVLSFSTSVERLAMHGTQHLSQLDSTIQAIRDQAGQPLGAVAANGMTALMQAIDFQDRDVVAALLRVEPALATTRLCSPHDERLFNLPIHFAAQIAARRDVPEALLVPQIIDQYANVFGPKSEAPRDDLGRTPLHLAVTGPSSRVAEWIIEMRPGLVDVEDGLGRTPLHCCASVVNSDLLLARGAGVNHTDKIGMTALHRASYLGDPELVASLLRHSPKLDLRNNRFGTPLHCAVISGSIDVVVALLDAGSPVDAVDLKGNTPVHVAARMDRHVILRTLLQRGADIRLRNHNGRDAQRVAAAVGHHGNTSALRVLQRGQAATTTNRIMATHSDESQGQSFVAGATLESLSLAAVEGDKPPDFDWDPDGGDTGDISDGLPDGAGFEGAGGGGSSSSDFGSLSLRDTSDWSEFGDDQTEESFDDRDVRMARLPKAVQNMTDVYVPVAVGVATYKRSLLETMDLVCIYFDDAVWQPPLSSRLVEIMADTAHDLAAMMNFSFNLVSKHAQTPEASEEACAKWLSVYQEGMKSASLGPATNASTLEDRDIADGERADSSVAAATPSVEEEHDENPHGQAEEDEKKLSKNEHAAADKGKRSKNQVMEEWSNTMNKFVEQWAGLKDFTLIRAAQHVSRIVAETKPSWVLPGRDQKNLEAMVIWEVMKSRPSEQQRPGTSSEPDSGNGSGVGDGAAGTREAALGPPSSWPDNPWTTSGEVDCAPTTAKRFPQLFRERGSERYRRWRQLKQKAYGGDTGQESPLEKWRRERDPMREDTEDILWL